MLAKSDFTNAVNSRDEIVGFANESQMGYDSGTDCVNVMNLSESERVRLSRCSVRGSNLTSGLYPGGNRSMPITEQVCWWISRRSLQSARLI